MEVSYQVIDIKDICRAKSVTPNPQVLQIFQSRGDTLSINFQTSENEFFCIICILQENLEFIKSLSIQSQDLTSTKLSLLAKLFKISTHIKKLSISLSSFPSPDSFCLLCNSLQTNSTLSAINFSNNNLTDSYGLYICDMITYSPSIREVVLDSNFFKTTDFGQCLSVSNIELVSLNKNPLSQQVLFSVISSTKVNRNLKSLSVKGIQAENIGEIISDALDSNKLVYLGFDLGSENLETIKKIENSLIFNNKTLVILNSDKINWNEVHEKHPCFGIKKALLANMWFYNSDKPSLLNEEVFREVQAVLWKKIKNDEALQSADNTKSISLNSRLGSISGSLAYSESSFVELKTNEKDKFDMIAEVVELVNGMYERCAENIKESIEVVLERVTRVEEKSKNEVQEKSKNLSEKIEKISEKLEKLSDQFERTSSSELNERVQENSDLIKGLDLKLEKQYFHVKSIFKNLNSVYCSQSQLQSCESRLAVFEEKLQSVIEKNEFQGSLEASFKDESHFAKSIQSLQKQHSELDKKIKELNTALSANDDKISSVLKIKDLLKSRDEDIYKKIYDTECDILELKNTEKLEEIHNSLQKTQTRLQLLEEVVSKNQENNFFQLTEQNLLLAEVQQKVNHLQSQTEIEENKDSIDLPVPEIEPKKPEEKFNFSRNLVGRIEKLEKLNIHKRALEVAKNFEEELDFVPGQAESLVRSAVLEKIGKSSGKSANMIYRTIAPITPKNNYSSFEEDPQPSVELLESLRSKGMYFSNY